jgi:hypothetical protein
MADQKVSDLPSLNGSAVDPADLLYIVDSSAGTAGSKKITIGQFQLAPYSGGTVNGVAYFDGTKVVASGSDLVFDGTNLGVGTAAPGARVHTVKTSAGAATVGAFLQNSDNTLNTEVRLAFAANTALLSSDRYGWIGYVNTGGTNGGALTFATTPGGTPATEKMRLDSSGNLGIGTTSPAEKLTVAAGGVDRVGANISGAVTQLRLGSSGVGDAMMVLQYNRTTGAYQFSEGINGNTGSPDIAVDAAGNVGIGTGSPTSKLDVDGSVVFGAAIFTGKNVSTSDVAIELGGQRTGNGNAYLDLHAFSGGDYAARFGRTSGVNGIAQIFNTGTGEMQITQFGAAPIVFSTNGSERARITNGGELLVGATSNANNYKYHVLQNGNDPAIGVFANSATTPYGINVYYGGAAPNNSNANTSFLYCNDISAVRIQLSSNGGIANYQANDTNLSDRREKTNFAPSKSYLGTICAIPVQTFNYIDQNLEEDPGLTLGVVAQDVQAVAPELVHEFNWGTEDDPKVRLSVYQTDMQYALMKCIQELKAELDATKARLAALEAK